VLIKLHLQEFGPFLFGFADVGDKLAKYLKS
jgi:hypothetical protein